MEKNPKKKNYNLLNIVFVLFIGIIFGLSCSDDRSSSTNSTPVPRRSEYIMPDDTPTTNANTNSVNTNSESNTMTTPTETKPNTSNIDKSSFYSVLDSNLAKRNLSRRNILDENNPVEKRILHEYGAVFLTTATPPTACMFKSEAEVTTFQNSVSSSSQNIGGATVQLQSDAMKALLAAIEEAKSQGLNITPRDGDEASKRGFDDTLRLWKSRFEPACEHWKKKGRLTDEQINKLKSLPISEQVREVLELEKQGIYFNTFFNATILSSVAAPGTSQHLSMLAFDANEFGDSKVRKVLANHGWFRTVKGDDPHFTFLGVKESDLTNMGLQKIETPKGEFWIPKV